MAEFIEYDQKDGPPVFVEHSWAACERLKREAEALLLTYLDAATRLRAEMLRAERPAYLVGLAPSEIDAIVSQAACALRALNQ